MSIALREAGRGRSLDYVFLIELEMAPGEEPARYSTGFRNLDWDMGDQWGDPGVGEVVWQGVGHVIDLELPEQGEEIAVTEFTLQLSGAGDAGRALAQEKVRARRIRIWLAHLDDRRRVFAAQPIIDDVQDRVSLHDGEELTVTLHCLGNFAWLANQAVRRWSDEHQRAWLDGLGLDPDSDTGLIEQPEVTSNNTSWFPQG